MCCGGKSVFSFKKVRNQWISVTFFLVGSLGIFFFCRSGGHLIAVDLHLYNLI